MTLRGREIFFTRSVNPIDVQAAATDPLASIGGNSPNGEVGSDPVTGSRFYRSGNADAARPIGNVINDTQTDTSDSDDPAVGDWIYVTDGPAGGTFGKVTAVDYGTGDITIDRELAATSQVAGDTNFRNSRPGEWLFEDLDAAAVTGGYIDYRMIWVLINNVAGGETGWQAHIEPIKPNGCRLDATWGAAWNQNSLNDNTERSTTPPADRFTDPLTARGAFVGGVGSVSTNDVLARLYEWTEVGSQSSASPPEGGVPSDAVGGNLDLWAPLWIRRVVPENGDPGGECVFLLVVTVPDALTQDPTADPNPWQGAVVIGWNNESPGLTGEFIQDRIAYRRGAARLEGTIRNNLGQPQEGVQAFFRIESGPGSLVQEAGQRSDENGRVVAVYEAPDAVGVDPEIRLVIPTHGE